MKLKHISYLAVLALVSLASCNDFLDKVPDTRVDLKTPEQLRMLMVNAYPTASYSLIGEMSSDNVVDNNSPDDQGVRYNLGAYDIIDDELFAFEEAKSTSGADSPSDVWEAYYHSIACCNAVLERVAELEAEGRADEVSAVKGEALVLRSYCHFILANLFCDPYRGPELSKTIKGIPYVTKPETEVLVHYERGNLADVYAQCQKDLEEGLPLINDGLYAVPKYHFNKTAANAYAARFYLFSRNYKKCLECANLALGGEGTDATQYLTDIWAAGSNFYYISDIARYYTDIVRANNFMLIPTYSVFWRHFVSSGRYVPNRDAKRATIQGPGPTWEAFKWSMVRGNKKESFSMHPCFFSVLGSAGKSEYGTYFAGPIGELFEYTDKVAGIGFCHNVRAEFNGEETLMCRAEAKAFLGDVEGAVADLKTWELSLRSTPVDDDRMDYYKDLSIDLINSFYGSKDPGYGIVKKIHIDEVFPSAEYSMPADLEPLLQCVQHFRRIVTVHNGMRFFDIKRLGLEITHVIGKEARTETLGVFDARKALQIPNEVIAAGLEPNDRIKQPAGGTENLGTIEKYQPVK